MRSDFRWDINALRALAIGLVLLFHFQIPGFSGGYIGVDVFFVISGFLMANIIYQRIQLRTFRYGAYLMERIARIFPALFAAASVTLILGYFLVDPIQYKRLAYEGASSILFVSNFYFSSLSGYFSPNAELSWFLHTWSLSVEWQFYIILPMIIAVLNRRIGRFDLLMPGLAAGIVVSLALAIYAGANPGRLSTYGFFLLPTRAWELLAGGILGLVVRRYDVFCALERNKAASMAVLLCGFALIALAAVLNDARTPWPSYHAILPVLGTLLILSANNNQARLFSSYAVSKVGIISYSVYIWHWPIKMLLFNVFDVHALLPSIAGIVLSLIVGGLSYRFVESTTLGSFKTGGRGRRAAVVATLSSGALALVACVLVFQLQGLPSRSTGNASLVADSMQAENEWAFPPDCALSGRSLAPSCWVGEGSDVTVVFGDSHAEMLFPYFAKQQGRTAFVTSAGCPTLPGVIRPNRIDCVKWRSDAMAFIKAIKPQKVLYVAYWPEDVASRGNVAGQCVGDTGGCSAQDARADWETLRTGLQTEVADLQNAGAKVVFLNNFPVSPVNVPQTLVADEFEGVPFDARFEYKFSGKASLIARLVDDTALSGVDIVETAPIICSGDGACKSTNDGGFSLFKDDNHLRPGFVEDNIGRIAAW